MGDRLMLVDDDANTLSSLGYDLQRMDPELDVLGRLATDEQHAVATVVRAQPDVVVMNPKLPTWGGLEAASRITSALPHTWVIVLAGHDEPRARPQGTDHGIFGFFDRDDKPRSLRQMVRRALQEPRRLAGFPASQTKAQRAPLRILGCRRFVLLSPRERSVMELLPHGLHNPELAERLGLGLETVKSHLSRSYEKLGARNRTEAFALYQE